MYTSTNSTDWLTRCCVARFKAFLHSLGIQKVQASRWIDPNLLGMILIIIIYVHALYSVFLKSDSRIRSNDAYAWNLSLKATRFLTIGFPCHFLTSTIDIVTLCLIHVHGIIIVCAQLGYANAHSTKGAHRMSPQICHLHASQWCKWCKIWRFWNKLYRSSLINSLFALIGYQIPDSIAKIHPDIWIPNVRSVHP